MSTDTTTTVDTATVQTYSAKQLAERTGLYPSEIDRARQHQLVPGPDVDGRWSVELAERIAAQVEQIRAGLAAQQALGANRCAARLAELTDLPVAAEDVAELAGRGLLTVAGHYKQWPLYRLADVEALADHPDLPALVAERRAWMAASIDVWDAAERLGWRRDELLADAAACGVRPGAFGRLALADVDALAVDETFTGRRLLGPEQAAAHFDVRRTDFEYAVAAGWLSAAKFAQVPVGRRSTVTVPLYRAGDVDALREIPGVDWEAVRAVPAGRPSALREYVRRPPSRAQILRRVAADLGARFNVEIWLYHCPGRGWELDWETVNGTPTREQITAAITADPVAAQYRRDLAVSTDAGAAVNWARAMLAPRAAVILDTETTDLFGAIIEIAVIDACTGKTLLNTLVDPGPEYPIQPGAQAVHGLSDADLVGAPTWDKVLPKLKRVTKNRTMLAYNSDYDESCVRADTERAGLKLGHLGDDDRWGCVMLRRTDWTRAWRWLPLGGGHRALGDAQSARAVLMEMTAPLAPAPRRRTPRI